MTLPNTIYHFSRLPGVIKHLPKGRSLNDGLSRNLHKSFLNQSFERAACVAHGQFASFSLFKVNNEFVLFTCRLHYFTTIYFQSHRGFVSSPETAGKDKGNGVTNSAFGTDNDRGFCKLFLQDGFKLVVANLLELVTGYEFS